MCFDVSWFFFFFKQKTAYEMRISDWSSDVCSSDLLQTDALTAAGCYKIWTDVASGSKDDRPQLSAVIEHLRPGDTLAVWRLDRLGRSLPHLLETVAHLESIGVGFTSLTEEINTTTSGGRLIFTIFGALAEFERNLLRERTFAGLEAAKRQGRTGGRPAVLDDKQKAIARKMKGAGVPRSPIDQKNLVWGKGGTER